MVTQSGDPNNKSKPAFRKYCSYCHKNNHSISNCYQKQRDDEYQKYNNQRSRTPQQSFVQYFRSKPSNSQENRTDNTNPYSSDNDRNKHNQNYYNERYRNNSNYRYNSRSRCRSRSQSQGSSFKRYNYPYRSPSRPREFRSRSRTPSRNRPQNRINQVDVKSTKDNDSTKFEIHTCQTTEIANTITPYSWFYPLYIHASEAKDNILPSQLEILFLLNTGASISVLNLPTFHVISKQLNINVPTNLQNKRAKTLTVANQTEVPIIHYISITCFTELNHQTRSFNIDFAVANIKYNILGTPFFKKHIQNIDFQQNIMTYIWNNIQSSQQKQHFPHLQKKITHIFLTSILLNVKNQFTLNQGQEKPYISQLKTIQIYILNLKIIQNSIQQTHIHISYKNLKISFIS